MGVYIDERGTPLEIMVREGKKISHDLCERAKAAARATLFHPATRDGVRGRMWVEIVYRANSLP